MSNLDLLLVLIPALPLAAALLTGALGKNLLREQSHLPALIAMPCAFVLSLALLFQVAAQVGPAEHHGAEHAAAAEGHAAENGAANHAAAKTATIGYEHTYTLWTWANIADAERLGGENTAATGPRDFTIDITLRADPLTCIMLSMVTFVSSLVVLYSVGYMHHDPGYWRFFAYVSLFVFSMTMLVSVSNFALLYVFWEAVGVCSYLLIGFWFQKPEAAAAGKKAFLVNRVGDFGFALGVFLIWTTYGTLNFHDTVVPGAEGAADTVVSGVLGQSRLALGSAGYVGGSVGMAICLLLLLGACGKSAQFPLHTWLPDAMEGPTPVSALIHAATMVTAGVYMVTRCTPLFMAAPDAQQVVAVVGGFTALLAGLIALTQNDLKRVLAYSTVSQLGFMFLGLGTGSLLGIVGGMFHLFTHAFFKALLFLGAGSVMHAMGNVIDMRRFGGLRQVMPYTHWTFLIGCLALAGVLPFAGFWSKDMILDAVHVRAHDGGLFQYLYWAAVFTATLTAFYTFRAFLMTFYGEERIPEEAGHHAHESPPAMTMPLVILAVCSVVVGAYFEWTHGFAHMLAAAPSLAFAPMADTPQPAGLNKEVAATSTLVALAGIGLAMFLYLGDRSHVKTLGRVLQPLYLLSYGKFFFDEIYDLLVVWPLRVLAGLSYFLDRVLIDGLVNLVAQVPRGFGWVFRSLQTGMVQFYALAMVLGLLVLAGTLLLWPGP
ncbi:MAG: NADH-quinone oxidoreductase subunit L [Pirellulales bacterium]|nr:NADH-quinone oxidoreductase subunit L [Pirellulales bacterium]